MMLLHLVDCCAYTGFVIVRGADVGAPGGRGRIRVGLTARPRRVAVRALTSPLDNGRRPTPRGRATRRNSSVSLQLATRAIASTLPRYVACDTSALCTMVTVFFFSSK